MDLNCGLCEASLEINETGRVVFCPQCDRKPDRRKEHLGGLLDAIKEDMIGADLLTKLWLEARKKQIDDNIDEATN